MKKYLVVGGGTAGWITALYLQKWFPNDQITVVSDEKTGIIGVGEATTPSIIQFLNDTNISVEDVITHAGGTIKNGISFENWNGDGKRYFHGFGERLVETSVNNVFDHDCNNFYIKQCIKENKSLNDYLYMTSLSYDNKVDLFNTAFALHFDTTLMGRYLSKVGKDRGINHIEGYCEEVHFDNQNISKITLKDGRDVEADFFFDCSGFARLLIGKAFNTPWKSYKKHLPMKSAIPFWTEHQENIQPYTSAIAMKYGWVWQIPLQHRNGCGYVFDSDYIDMNQAQQEVEEMLGHEIEVNKLIEFDAGNFEKVWVNNCIANGIASSFIEPLESTSIFLTIQAMQTLARFLNEIPNYSERGVEQYNKIINNNMSHIMKFVYLHYMTKRRDSKFWIEFKDKNPPPDGFDDFMKFIEHGDIRYYDVYGSQITATFDDVGFLQVADGLGLIKEVRNDNYTVSPSPKVYKNIIDDYKNRVLYHNQELNRLRYDK